MDFSENNAANRPESSQILALPEYELQRLIRRICADSARVWQSTNGIAMQILSIGEWNHAAGPDFLDVAVFAEGRVHVGNAEFHRSLRDWYAHDHSNNPDFAGLLLHIVVQANDHADIDSIARYTLVVSKEELQASWERSFNETHFLNQVVSLSSTHSETMATLRDWAMRRILRKAHYAASILNPYKPYESLLRMLDEFVERNQYKQRRPRGVAQMLVVRNEIAEAFVNTPQNTTPNNTLRLFFASIEEGLVNEMRSCLQTILNKSILRETIPPKRINTSTNQVVPQKKNMTGGKALRQEFFLNILLPLGIALAWHSEQHGNTERISNFCVEFLWDEFFALRSHSRYSSLQRRFPDIEQEYAFVQQGLLEYLAELHPPSTPSKVSNSSKASPELRAVAAHAHAEYVLTLYAAHKQ